MTRIITAGIDVVDQFPVWNADGYTKKSGETSFTTRLWLDGAVSSQPVTVVEIGVSGEYKVTFTPDAEGFWLLEVIPDFNNDVWQGEYATGWLQEFEFEAADDGTTVEWGVWLELNGRVVLDLDSMDATLRDNDGTAVVTFPQQTTQTSEGVFKFTTPSANVGGLKSYYLAVVATRGTEVWSGNLGLATA